MGAKYPIYAPDGMDVVGEVQLNVDIPHSLWDLSAEIKRHSDGDEDVVGFVLTFLPAKERGGG